MTDHGDLLLDKRQAFDAMWNFVRHFINEQRDDFLGWFVFEIDYVDLDREGNPMAREPAAWPTWSRMFEATSGGTQQLTTEAAFGLTLDYMWNWWSVPSEMSALVQTLSVVSDDAKRRPRGPDIEETWISAVHDAVNGVRASG